MPSPLLPATAPRVNARTGLAPADLLVPRLEAALAAAGFVPFADLPALNDEILATLDPPVPDALYPHAAARLHTLACTACPRAVWLPAGSGRAVRVFTAGLARRAAGRSQTRSALRAPWAFPIPPSQRRSHIRSVNRELGMRAVYDQAAPRKGVRTFVVLTDLHGGYASWRGASRKGVRTFVVLTVDIRCYPQLVTTGSQRRSHLRGVNSGGTRT